MKIITLTIEQFNKTLKEHVAYRAHPEVECGKLSITGATGHEPVDNSCIALSKSAAIDITGDITLGKWVNISSGAILWTHAHPFEGKKPLLIREMEDQKSFVLKKPKVIGDDVWIYSATILPQCQEIARGVIVGAGAVVTKNINEEYSIWAGNPARKIGMR